jgi:23S rRNA (guanosine2251-2'-O)-methyltransferase
MTTRYEIRLCDSCGLRYPLVQGHPHGTRCPICMGSTRLLLSRELAYEPMRDRPESFYRGGAKTTKNPIRDEKGISVLLDNIRSAWNVGSIFRSADGFGFVHAYLCGITPTPEVQAVAKTSLGAEESVPWSHHKDSVKLVKGLKKEGYAIFALEDDERAVSIKDEGWGMKYETKDIVLILGSEVTGVDPGLSDLCDEILYIPMRGEKKSFNVAMAFSVAAYVLTGY